jgi:hypothetical protein
MMSPPFRNDLARGRVPLLADSGPLLWHSKEVRMPAERTTMRHVRDVLRLKGATATIKFFLDDVQQATVRPLDQCQR